MQHLPSQSGPLGELFAIMIMLYNLTLCIRPRAGRRHCVGCQRRERGWAHCCRNSRAHRWPYRLRSQVSIHLTEICVGSRLSADNKKRSFYQKRVSLRMEITLLMHADLLDCLIDYWLRAGDIFGGLQLAVCSVALESGATGQVTTPCIWLYQWEGSCSSCISF